MNNINAFAISPDEKFIVAGTLLGELLVINTDSFKIEHKLPASYGAINCIAIHQTLPYVAIYGEDNWLVILDFDKNTGKLAISHTIRTRDIKPEGDPYLPCRSNSQALAFHKTKPRLASRGGSSALFELRFDDKGYEILHATRACGSYDLITVTYVGDGNKILTGSGIGEAVLSENGETIKSWKLPDENQQNLHWFEPLSDNEYLIASDTGKILHLDINGEMTAGPWFARDDMEHVTYHQQSKRAFSASFDRRICEIDLQTLAVKQETWHAPFKLRWIKLLSKDPNTMIVQCRNGALYKIDIRSKPAKLISEIKLNPRALWSATVLDNKLIIAGEGDDYITYDLHHQDTLMHQPVFKKSTAHLGGQVNSYTKRIISDENTKIIAFGRVDGHLIIKKNHKTIINFDLNSPIRDICFGDTANSIYVATESGNLFQVDIAQKTKMVLHHHDLPIWAIAYNKTQNVLAFSVRFNVINFINTKNNQVMDERRIDISTIEPALHKSIKRLRWSDDRHLLIGHSTNITRYDFEKNQAKKLLDDILPNTIENFAWDKNQRYLIVIVYSRELYLCEFDTGKVLYQHADQSDYSKGLLFLDNLSTESNFWGDFIAYGRYGEPRYHRINNDRIITLGNIPTIKSNISPFPINYNLGGKRHENFTS